MSPKKKNAFEGLHAGPFSIGRETQADMTVTAIGNDGEPVVVGRFPFTRHYDAAAQAQAYTQLPDMIRTLRRVVSSVSLGQDDQAEIATEARDLLEKAGAA